MQRVANPTPFQFNVFIVVLALAAAGTGAMLPGTLKVEIKHLPIVRAGGAIALFVLVLVFRPALGDVAVRLVAPDSPPNPVAEAFLTALDNGNVSAAWDQLDSAAKGVVAANKEEMQQIYDNYRKPLGAVLSRQLVGSSGSQGGPGLPVGLFRALNYRTKFAGAEGCRPEAVTLRATETLDWRVYSYQIWPSSIEC